MVQDLTLFHGLPGQGQGPPAPLTAQHPRDQRAWSPFPGPLLSAPAQLWAGQNVSAGVPWGSPPLGNWPEPQDGGACPSPGFLWLLLSGVHRDQHEGWAEAVLGRVAGARDPPSLESPDGGLNPHSWRQAGEGHSVAQALRSAQWPRRLPAQPLCDAPCGWDLPSHPAASLHVSRLCLSVHWSLPHFLPGCQALC